MKIGIDPGKFGIKAVTKRDGQWDKFYLKSKFTESPVNISYGKSFNIKTCGKEYLMGEGGDEYSLDVDKESIQHKLGTYIAINQLAHEEPVEVILGCPLSIYKNEDKKERYENYIRESGVISCEINYIKQIIEIVNLMTFPECGGIAYAQDEKVFENRLVGVLDIGGLNINGCLFDNLNPVKGSDFTENLGSIILKDRIKSELNKEYPEINLQDYEMDTVLKEGLSLNGEIEKKADKIIQEVIESHFNEIIKVMKKKGWSIKTLKIIIGGGGSLDIGINTVNKFIPQARMCNDPIWDNAKGNYIVANMLF